MLENTTQINKAVINSKYMVKTDANKAVKNPIDNVNYGRDTVVLSDKQNNSADNNNDKNSKKRFIIAGASLALAGFITLFGVLLRGHTQRLNKKTKNIFQNWFEKNNLDKALNFTKAKDKIKLSAEDKKVIQMSNFMNNTANIKDCYLMPFLKKFPILRGFANKTSKLYTDTGIKMTQGAYKHASSVYNNLDTKILNALNEAEADEIKKLIDKRNALINSSFGQESLLPRVKGIQKAMSEVGENGIAVEVRDTFTDLIKRFVTSKGKDRAGFFNFVAEDMVKNQKAAYVENLAKMRDDILKADETIFETLKGKVDEKTFEILSASRQNAQKSLNNALRTEGNDLFDKIRDIEIGSAPNDILGMLGTTGMLGVYLAQAKDKDQRVEAALTTGLPLGLGMLATTFATMKMYTGMKAIAFGAVATFISNNIGKIINKEYQKKNNVQPKEVEIPTIDKTVENIKDKITNAP